MQTQVEPITGLFGRKIGEKTTLPSPEFGNLGKHRDGAVIWLCGDYAEEICTSSTWVSGVAPETGSGAKTLLSVEEIVRRCAVRAQKNVRRIVNTNKFRFLWTLTIEPAKEGRPGIANTPVPTEGQRDYDTVRALWKSFIRRLYAVYDKFPWLVVFELHDSEKTSEEKRGTYHLHFACNAILRWTAVGAAWQCGFVRFDDFAKKKRGRNGSVQNPGAYLSKYIGKSFNVENYNRKRFTCSRNIKRPRKLSGPGFDSYVREGGLAKSVVFKSERFFVNGETTYGTEQTTYRLVPKENWS